MKTLYFDESGNTGGDLLSKDQRYFVLASVDFDETESKEMLLDAFGSSDKEVHFKKKKNSEKGSKQILSFLSKNIDSIKRHSKIVVVHKEFSVCCSLLLYCFEPIFYDAGLNYWDGGRNIVEANLFYYVLKYTYGEKESLSFYRNFINYFEKRDEVTKTKLLHSLGVLRKRYNDDFAEYFLDCLICSFRDFDGYLEEGLSLDPAYYCLSGLVKEWLKSLKDRVEIVHDDSSALKNLVPQFYQFFKESPEQPEEMIGYAEHKTPFPLNVNGPIEFVTSSSSYSIQVCDLLASASAYCYNNIGNKDDDFCRDLIEYAKDFPFVDCIIPQMSFGVIQDRIKKKGDIEPIDYIAKYMYYKERGSSSGKDLVK